MRLFLPDNEGWVTWQKRACAPHHTTLAEAWDSGPTVIVAEHAVRGCRDAPPTPRVVWRGGCCGRASRPRSRPCGGSPVAASDTGGVGASAVPVMLARNLDPSRWGRLRLGWGRNVAPPWFCRPSGPSRFSPWRKLASGHGPASWSFFSRSGAGLARHVCPLVGTHHPRRAVGEQHCVSNVCAHLAVPDQCKCKECVP